jgi:hypothetical protein
MCIWTQLEAEKAFTGVARARRRAAIAGRLFRRCVGLAVYDESAARRSARRGVQEIPLDAIAGTVEPNQAAQFDGEFRPAAHTRCRWERVWMAVQRGVTLPPISVVQVGNAYAIRDGHHRVSVAKARGAMTINAIVAG